MFGPSISSLEQTVNRAWLARILSFYARKALRHGLEPAVCDKLLHAIDVMVKRDTDPPEAAVIGRIGLIFCPELDTAQPTVIEQVGQVELWLFGAGALPEPAGEVPLAKAGKEHSAAAQAAKPSSAME